MANTRNPDSVASIYRYFNTNNVRYDLVQAIISAATVTNTFSKMRDAIDAEHLSNCVTRVLDNAAAQLHADHHALYGDPATTWAAD